MKKIIMKAVIYARVSTNDQETERQVNELIVYAKQLNLEVVETFTEKISGTVQQNRRPIFSALFDYLKEHNIKNVISHELSRIGRNLRDTINIIDEFTKDGICIYTKAEGISTLNPDGSKNSEAVMRIGIFGSIAEMEIETLRTRVKSGLRNSKLNGGANGAVQPYGFQSINKKLAVQPDEVKIVEDIYNRYLKGYSMIKIAQHLNDLGIPTRKNKRWVDKTINDMLKNPLYKGERFHNGEIVPYELDILIPYEKWEAVQSLIKKKAIYNNRDSKNINLLKGLVFCGNCGEPLYMHRRKNLSDNVYKCLSSKTGYNGKSCGLKGINIDLLNIIAASNLIISGSFDLDKLKTKIVKHNMELQIKIDNLEKKITKLNKELYKYTSGYGKGIIKESLFLKLSRVCESDIDKTVLRIKGFKDQLQMVPEQPKELGYDMSGENFIGEFQKFFSKIVVRNVPLEGTPFNQRMDNIAYEVNYSSVGYKDYINKSTIFVSSRDQRIFTKVWHDDGMEWTDTGIGHKNVRQDWNYTGVSFDKVKRIEI